MDLILAFSLQDQVEKYGAYVGLAAFLGLAVLSLLYFAQARELKRLRDWAGRAPERALELEARVVAQAEEALREVEPSGTVGPAVPVAKPAAAPASGNGPIPMGPRPAVAVAALTAQAQAAPATVEAPAVGADEEAQPVTVGGGDDAGATAPGDTAGDEREPGGDGGGPEDRAAVPVGDEPAAEEEPAADEDRVAEEEAARSDNGVPAKPPTQIPRATPRPQPRPAPPPAVAAPLSASTPSRPATIPPRRGAGSRAALYTLIGVVVLAAAIFVPVYFTVLSGDDPEPQPNPIAEPAGTTPTLGAGAGTAEARPEKVVVVLNGTPIDGLASGERDKLINAGYSDEQGMIRIDNNQDQQCQDSVVYYGADERRQARDVARLLDITRTEQIDEETQALADSSDQTGTLPANVVALLCADKSP
jgi:LytR cell envelope-related transcriptional attenuator